MEELNAVVTQKIEVAPDLIELQVTPRDWELPEFPAHPPGVGRL